MRFLEAVWVAALREVLQVVDACIVAQLDLCLTVVKELVLAILAKVLECRYDLQDSGLADCGAGNEVLAVRSVFALLTDAVSYDTVMNHEQQRTIGLFISK